MVFILRDQITIYPYILCTISVHHFCMLNKYIKHVGMYSHNYCSAPILVIFVKDYDDYVKFILLIYVIKRGMCNIQGDSLILREDRET